MNTPDSQEIIKRFFTALYYLKDTKAIRGKGTFIQQYGIDRRNLQKLEKDPSRDIFQPAWLNYLVRDYGISATWLLTGRGEIIRHDKWNTHTKTK